MLQRQLKNAIAAGRNEEVVELRRQMVDVNTDLRAAQEAAKSDDANFKRAAKLENETRELDAKLELAVAMGRERQAEELENQLSVKQDELQQARAAAKKDDGKFLAGVLNRVKSGVPLGTTDEESDGQLASSIENASRQESSQRASVPVSPRLRELENDLRFNELQLKVATSAGKDAQVDGLKKQRARIEVEIQREEARTRPSGFGTRASSSLVEPGRGMADAASVENQTRAELQPANKPTIDELQRRLAGVKRELQDARELNFTDEIPDLEAEKAALENQVAAECALTEEVPDLPLEGVPERNQVLRLEENLQLLDDKIAKAVTASKFDIAQRLLLKRPAIASELSTARHDESQLIARKRATAYGNPNGNVEQFEAELRAVTQRLDSARKDGDDVQDLLESQRSLSESLADQRSPSSPAPADVAVVSSRVARLKAELAATEFALKARGTRANAPTADPSPFQEAELQQRRIALAEKLQETQTAGFEERRLQKELETISKQITTSLKSGSSFEVARLRGARDVLEDDLGAVQAQEAKRSRLPPPPPPRLDRLQTELETVGDALQDAVRNERYETANALVEERDQLKEEIQAARQSPVVPPRVFAMDIGLRQLGEEIERAKSSNKMVELEKLTQQRLQLEKAREQEIMMSPLINQEVKTKQKQQTALASTPVTTVGSTRVQELRYLLEQETNDLKSAVAAKQYGLAAKKQERCEELKELLRSMQSSEMNSIDDQSALVVNDQVSRVLTILNDLKEVG